MMSCHFTSYSFIEEELPRALDDHNDEGHNSEFKLNSNIGDLDLFLMQKTDFV